MKFSFQKNERISCQKEISFLFKKGKMTNCNGAKLFYSENATNKNRVVFTLRKNYGNAVERNKSKRFSREAYRLIKNDLKKGWDLSIFVYPGNDSFDIRTKQLNSLFLKADLLVKKS